MRKKRIWLRVVCILLLLLLIPQLWNAYSVYRSIGILDDPYVSFTTDCTAFAIRSARVDKVILQNGNGHEITVTDPEQITQIVEKLNALRFRYVAKKLDIGMGGWSWRVIVSGPDGASSYLFWDRVIEIDGLLVYTQKGYFADWIDLLEDVT